MSNEREITTDITEIQSTVRKYYEQLYAKKLDKLGEINKFLETYNLPKLNQEESENLNRLITTNEIEAVVKKTCSKQKYWTGWPHRQILPNIERTNTFSTY